MIQFKTKNVKHLLILLLLCSSMSISAQRIIGLNNEDANINLRRTTAVIPQEFLEEAKAFRSFAINPVLQSAENVSIGDFVALQLFEESNYKAVVSKITTDVNGNFTLTLNLIDYSMGFAIITTNTAGKSLVNVSIPELGRSFGSRHSIGTSGFYLIEVDESKLPVFTCGTCGSGTCTLHPLIPQEIEMLEMEYGEDVQTRSQSITSLSLDCGPAAFENPNAPAVIDVLVVYTPAVLTSIQVANAGGITSYLANMIANANLAFTNSQTGITIRLAHSAMVNYVEPTPHNMSVTLRRLQNTTDGFMDNVHELRRQHNADLVALISAERDVGGIAFLLSNTEGNPNWGFSVTGVAAGAGTSQTFAHEIGHNMGLGHGAQQISGRAEGIFPYSLGWRFQGNVNNPWGNRFYTTVMAYQGGQFYADGLTAARVPFFSNPTISHLGAPTGHTTQADAARTLREVKHVVAFYSERMANLPDAPTNIVVSTPTDYGATFTWDAMPNASHYSFYFNTDDGWRWWPIVDTNSRIVNQPALLSPCSTYEFHIESVNECGDRARSRTFTFTTRCVNTDPTVITSETVDDITHNSATLNKTVTAASGTPITNQGFRYQAMFADDWNTSTDGILTALMPNTEYRFHAFATTALGTFNGNVFTFTTLIAIPPTVVTQDATDITCNSATLHKSVTAETETIIETGFEYKILGEENWQISTSGELTGLTTGAIYLFRAFATTASRTTYGDELTFTPVATQTQTIDFPVIVPKIYGDADITLPQTSSAGLTISYESSREAVATISGNILTITGAGVALITAAQSGDCNYIEAEEVVRTLVVSKAPLKIIAEDKTREKGQQNPEFTLTFAGFKNNDTESDLDVLPTIFTEADENSPVGEYVIVLSGGSDRNYEFILVDGILTVIESSVGICQVLVNQLKIFPNPVKSELFIQSELQVKKVEIYSLTGVLLIEENNFIEKISVSTLPRGIYLLKVHTDKGVAVSKFVKE